VSVFFFKVTLARNS